MKLFNFSKQQQPNDITNKTLLIAIEGLRTFVCSLADQHYNLLEQINKRPTNALVITDIDTKTDILKEQMNILLGEKIPLINDNIEKLLAKLSDRLIADTSNPTLAWKPVGPLSSYDNSNKSLAEMQADMATADEMVKKYIEIHEEAGPMPDHFKKNKHEIALDQKMKQEIDAIKCRSDQKLPDPEPNWKYNPTTGIHVLEGHCIDTKGSLPENIKSKDEPENSYTSLMNMTPEKIREKFNELNEIFSYGNKKQLTPKEINFVSFLMVFYQSLANYLHPRIKREHEISLSLYPHHDKFYLFLLGKAHESEDKVFKDMLNEHNTKKDHCAPDEKTMNTNLTAIANMLMTLHIHTFKKELPNASMFMSNFHHKPLLTDRSLLIKEFLENYIKQLGQYVPSENPDPLTDPNKKFTFSGPVFSDQNPIKDINNKIEKLESKIKELESIIAKPIKHADDYQSRFPNYKPKYVDPDYTNSELAEIKFNFIYDNLETLLNDIAKLLKAIVDQKYNKNKKE